MFFRYLQTYQNPVEALAEIGAFSGSTSNDRGSEDQLRVAESGV